MHLWKVSYFGVIPANPPYLVKTVIWSGFEMEPFKVELFEVFFSGGQKFFFIKKEKNYLSDLSHDVRKPFSANETFNAELF